MSLSKAHVYRPKLPDHVLVLLVLIPSGLQVSTQEIKAFHEGATRLGSATQKIACLIACLVIKDIFFSYLTKFEENGKDRGL